MRKNEHIPVTESIEAYQQLSPGEDIQELVQYLAEKRGSLPESQKDILELQEKKQCIMDRLREDLELVKNGSFGHFAESAKEESVKNAEKKHYPLSYENGKYYLAGKEKQELSFGQIITDQEWDISYDFPWEKAPIEDAKRYLLERAKIQLRDLFNQQILLDELSRKETPGKLRESYQGIHDSEEAGSQEARGGIVAEKMLRTFLKRLSIDGLPIKVEDVSLFDDVAGKVDFILSRKDSLLRGVNVEANQERKKIGIQYTMNVGKIDKKLADMDENRIYSEKLNISELLLVVFPLELVKQKYKRWQKDKEPGGPLNMFPLMVKEGLFKKTLAHLFNEQELDTLWANIKEKEKSHEKPATEQKTKPKKQGKFMNSFAELFDVLET